MVGVLSVMSLHFADEQTQIQSIADQLKDRAGEIAREPKRVSCLLSGLLALMLKYKCSRICMKKLLEHRVLTLLVCVGTRPDCVPDSVLELLAGYVEQGYEIWLELGLQTANIQNIEAY